MLAVPYFTKRATELFDILVDLRDDASVLDLVSSCPEDILDTLLIPARGRRILVVGRLHPFELVALHNISAMSSPSTAVGNVKYDQSKAVSLFSVTMYEPTIDP